MKPRLRLYADGTVSLADAPSAFQFYCNTRHLRRLSEAQSARLIWNCRQTFGSIAEYCRRFDIPPTLFMAAVHARNIGVALGGGSGTLRVLLGMPTASSAHTKPLTDLRVPLRAICIARNGPAAVRGGQQ